MKIDTELLNENTETPEDDSRTGVSFSQYKDYATCPWQWKVKSVDKIKEDSNIHAVFGTAMHDTIQTWINMIYNDSAIKAKTFDMHEYFKIRFKDLAKEELIFDDKQLTTAAELSEFYIDGCNILNHIRKEQKEWFPKTHKLIGTEVPLKVDLGNNLVLRGYLDVVLYHKASRLLYIYDFKTSVRGWTYQKKDTKKTDQLLLYKKYYSELYNIPMDNIKIEFIILKRKINEDSPYPSKRVVGFEPANGKPSVEKADKRFKEFINTTFDSNGKPILENIKANPSEQNCKYCFLKDREDLCSFSYYLKKKGKK